MRYSLLDILACPVTGEELVLVGAKDVERAVPDVYLSPATRTIEPSANGSLPSVGPLGTSTYETPLFNLISRLATSRGDIARNHSHEVVEGIVVAVGSGRWYPIRECLPILYPDSLRDWHADLQYLESIRHRVPNELFDALYTIRNEQREVVSGDNYKNSEITLLSKVEDPQLFLGPGYVSPFNWGAFEHSAALIRGFSNCLPFLNVGRGDFILDSGSGYCWTTEWLQKMGAYPVGIEINRTYLDVGRARMGALQPHLVVCDAENMPFKQNVFKAVLGFDAFHHIPNRKRAMQEFARTMTKNSRVVLVEPPSSHSIDPYSIEIMNKFGTMEIGMDLEDVKSYVEGNQHFA